MALDYEARARFFPIGFGSSGIVIYGPARDVKGHWKRNRFMCYNSVSERCSCDFSHNISRFV